MARGLNKVMLIGNLGRDPEVRYTAGGSAVANLRIATTESWRDKQTGEKKENTEWHSVVLFGKLGEIAGEYLRKGRQVYIEGRLEYGSYEKDGVKHYTSDIILDEMKMLGPKRETEANAPAASPAPAGGQESAPAGEQHAAPAGGQQAAPAPAPAPATSDASDASDPFAS